MFVSFLTDQPADEFTKVPEPTGKRFGGFYSRPFPNGAVHNSAFSVVGILDTPVHVRRAISNTRQRRTSHSIEKNRLHIVEPEGGHASPVLNCVPLPGSRGNLLEFYSFDEEYFGRLREGDFLTREHFHKYFTAVMKVKLRSRLHSMEEIEDVQQETFVRFFKALRDEKIKEPRRLGSYVVSICKNVLKEHYRDDEYDERFVPIDKENAPDLPAAGIDLVRMLSDRQAKEKLHKALAQLPERERRVLHAVVFEERDKDEVCREFGINRGNLRLILHRAKLRFKSLLGEQ